MHNITQFVAKMTADRQMKYESVTFRPQNSSKAQNPKTPTPNRNRKLIIQNSKDKFVLDKSSN